MKELISILLFITFALLALLHVYWAFGGKWAFSATLPTDKSGKRVLNPKPIESMIVGIGLLGFGIYYLLHSGLVADFLPASISKILSWLIPGIFLLRAIGDFRYVGFFKKIKPTTFSQVDTFYYSPLCITVSILGLLLVLIK